MAKRRPVREQRYGAGIVAGASDNDPTTVATLAVIGSTTVYELCGRPWAIIALAALLIVTITMARRSSVAAQTVSSDAPACSPRA